MVDSGDDRVVEFAQLRRWSPSTATPTEGISTPGRVPPPGVDATSTISAPWASARSRSWSTVSEAMRQNGIASPSSAR